MRKKTAILQRCTKGSPSALHHPQPVRNHAPANIQYEKPRSGSPDSRSEHQTSDADDEHTNDDADDAEHADAAVDGVTASSHKQRSDEPTGHDVCDSEAEDEHSSRRSGSWRRIKYDLQSRSFRKHEDAPHLVSHSDPSLRRQLAVEESLATRKMECGWTRRAAAGERGVSHVRMHILAHAAQRSMCTVSRSCLRLCSTRDRFKRSLYWCPASMRSRSRACSAARTVCLNGRCTGVSASVKQ